MMAVGDMSKPQPKKPKNWSANQRRFMEWLAMPSDMRLPLTQGQLARELKMDDGTLSDWKHIPGFYDEVNKLVDEHFADDYAPIVESFKREARNGSYQHQKTYFEMLGKYLPKQQVELSGGISLIEVILDAEISDDSNG